MKQKQIIIIALLAMAVVAIAGYSHLKKTSPFENKISDNTIKGTVANVVDRPNQAEDGYYGFDVIRSSGQKYSVNGSAYLNTPLSPDSRGEACVNLPNVKAGDKVEFKLPKSPDQPNIFTTCYKKNLAGYFFKLN